VRLSTSDADAEGPARLRRLIGRGLLGTVAAGALGAAVAWWLGQPVIRLVYGPRYVVAPWAVAGLVWSSVVLAAVLLLGAVLVARQRYRMVTVTWAVIAAVSAAILLAWSGDAVTAAVVGLVAGPTCGLVLAAVVVLSTDRGAAVGGSRPNRGRVSRPTRPPSRGR
jgi:O-antigen/teichoic acid export membrane protein